MVKRQRFMKNRNKNEKTIEDGKTFAVPKIVAEPKIDRAKKIKEKRTMRESTETNLEGTYLDPIKGNRQLGIPAIKLTGHDLAVIWSSTNEPQLYKSVESKPDRMNNRAVDYIIPHLKLLNFLLANMSEHFKNKIWNSGEFRTILENYLGISEYPHKKLSKEEKKARLKSANQWLVDSLKIIEGAIPGVFKQPLRDASKDYFNLINAICENEGIKDIKIPDIFSDRR